MTFMPSQFLKTYVVKGLSRGDADAFGRWVYCIVEGMKRLSECVT